MRAIEVPPEVKRGRNRLAVTVVLGHAFKHIYNAGLQSILLPQIKIDMGLSATQFGALATARQLTSGVTTMGAGYLGDRFAHRSSVMLGIALGLMGVAYFLAGSAPSYWLLFAAMLLVGIGPSLYHPPAIGALSRRFPDRLGFAISLHGTGGSVGQVLGPLVAASMLTVLMWRDVLRVSLFPALLAALLIWSMMRNIPGPAGGSSSTRAYMGSLRRLLSNRVLVVLVVITALRSMGQSAISSFLPVFLREDLDLSVTRVAVYLSLAQLAGIGAQPIMGVMSDRVGRKAALLPGMAALGLLFVALRFADPGIQLTLIIVAMGAFEYSLHSIFIAAAVDVAGGEAQSTVASLIYGASFLGTLSPLLAGVIADAYGVPSTFLYGGGVVLLATFILSLLRFPRTATRAANRSQSRL